MQGIMYSIHTKSGCAILSGQPVLTTLKCEILCTLDHSAQLSRQQVHSTILKYKILSTLVSHLYGSTYPPCIDAIRNGTCLKSFV